MKHKIIRVILIFTLIITLAGLLTRHFSKDSRADLEEGGLPPNERSIPEARPAPQNAAATPDGTSRPPGDLKSNASKDGWEERIRSARSGDKSRVFYEYVLSCGSGFDFKNSLELLDDLVGRGTTHDNCLAVLFAYAPQSVHEKVSFFLDLPPESKEGALSGFHQLALDGV